MRSRHRPAPLLRGWFLAGLLLLVCWLAACGEAEDAGEETATPLSTDAAAGDPSSGANPDDPTPDIPEVDLSLTEEDIRIEEMPVRAGVPFTISATLHNNSQLPARDIPVLFFLSPLQEEIGHTPYFEALTVTLAPSQSLEVIVPVNWNFPGGDHQLWIQVNRLPQAWRSRFSTMPEADLSDNSVLLDLVVDPFDAYASELCSGRTDVVIGPADVLPEPDRQRVLVLVHNAGNRAVYNLPVVVTGDQLSGIAYTPAIPPCGGTAGVYVEMDRPFGQGESLTVQVNPEGWAGASPEDAFENNSVSIVGGLGPEVVLPPGSGLDDYDFSITTEDIEIPEMWIVLVTVHNQGARDAAMVPILIENESGRKINDAIPAVQGDGLGIAAVRAGYLWIPGGTLTFTVNPPDAKTAYPEANRENNTATFTLP